MRGKFRIDCDAGWLNVALTLAPLSPPRVQFLEVTGGKTPSKALRQSAEAVTGAISVGPRDLRLASKMNRHDLSAILEATRLVYGSCRLGEAIAGDGAAKSSFALACDRGPLEMSLSLEESRISSVALGPPNDAACVP